MTREEAIEVLRRLPIGLMDLSCEQKSDLTEALNIALAALRGPTREQVERTRGHWITVVETNGREHQNAMLVKMDLTALRTHIRSALIAARP